MNETILIYRSDDPEMIMNLMKIYEKMKLFFVMKFSYTFF